jgi:hypothetical protein
LYSFLQLPVTKLLFGQNIVLSIKISQLGHIWCTAPSIFLKSVDAVINVSMIACIIHELLTAHLLLFIAPTQRNCGTEANRTATKLKVFP